MGGGQAIHAVLYVRDACGLDPPADPVVPPRLAGNVADLAPKCSPTDREQAVAGWLEWWRRMVAVEGASLLGEVSSGAGGAVPQRRDVARQVFDPPRFDSLGASPPLGRLARTSCEQALRWFTPSRTRSETSRSRAMKVVAEEVCAANRVSPGSLNAGVVALDVEGPWWNFPRPGVLLCSRDVLADLSLFSPLLRRAFEAGLGGIRRAMTAARTRG